MKILELTVRNFRNYENCSLSFHPGINILVGENAQGKTNLLESIHFLATGRSHRTANQLDLIRWGTTGFFLNALIEKHDTKVEIEFSFTNERQRLLKINGIVEKKLSSLLGTLNSVLFTPEDLLLLKGPPLARRRFLDIEISQISPLYLHTLRQYNRALAQRNSLLRHMGLSTDKALLVPWTEQIIKLGTRLTVLRQRALINLARYAANNLFDISQGKEKLTLQYRPWGLASLKEMAEADIAPLFREILREQADNELRRRQSLVGPHRDDFLCFINDVDVREFGSQGQQRSAVLAIKMAELEFMKEVSGVYPVLLLDDVLSELDYSRRQALLSLVDRGIQTVITGTEAGLFAGWQDKSLLLARISDGIIDVVKKGE